MTWLGVGESASGWQGARWQGALTAHGFGSRVRGSCTCWLGVLGAHGLGVLGEAPKGPCCVA